MRQARPEPVSRPRHSEFRRDRSRHRASARRPGRGTLGQTVASTVPATSFQCRHVPAGRARLCSSDFRLILVDCRRHYRPAPSVQNISTMPSASGRFVRLPVNQGYFRMLYAILCYHDEDFVGSWTREQDAAVMKKLAVVQDKLAKQGRLGPVARLLPTTSATTLRKEDPPLVLDGPYAETKEQLLGFYVVDCKNLDEALDVARDLGAANPGGAYEIRPVGVLNPGSVLAWPT